MIEIIGTIGTVTYRNEDNHYTIARLKTPGQGETITIVGHLAGVGEGEGVKLTGRWVTHARYGEQFKVESYAVTLPETVSGMRQYLGSGIIKGLGKSMARRIVEHFGENSLEIIETRPERLMEIEGLGKSKMEMISRAWDRHHTARKVMQFLQEQGVGVTHASAILKYYGKNALKILRERPYRLARDLPGAGFRVADAIALQNGFKIDDPERIKSSFLYLLMKNEDEGHAFVPRDELVDRCVDLTGAGRSLVEAALDELSASKEAVLEKRAIHEVVYTKKMHRAETVIALKIKAMLSIPIMDQAMDEDSINGEVLCRLALKLSREQVGIVRDILGHRVAVITGGPGTGKTTLIRTLCALFRKLGRKVNLCAPTGRAARRLSEVTHRKASTLHRMLLYDPDSDIFNRNQDNPLDTDVVIVDEASMVDTYLMYHLVCALPLDSVLILVGDIFQLPSVGPGNVLSDIIASKAVAAFFLTRIFRQAEQSPIVMSAHAIRRGEMPMMEKRVKEDGPSEFYFIECNDPVRMVAIISDLCRCRIRNAFPHIDEIQVLTPMHKGETGTINLNLKLQEVLNDRPGGLGSHGITFRTGDKVMHLKNNYQKEVFNGDIGVVDEVIKSENRLVVDYDGRLVEYDILELDELTLAYAISVHKSQGSEYPAVVLAMSTMHYPLLRRNLLYTAITRGKKLVVLVGSTRAVEIAVHNNKTHLRMTGLKERCRFIQENCH
ncbi:MAG: ATP-dependent RecD-like DNA helicase [Desulfamplus sp.]|nr:ATP-dependent RecD-like DNA helicase [Desulfamplus sp.]